MNDCKAIYGVFLSWVGFILWDNQYKRVVEPVNKPLIGCR